MNRLKLLNSLTGVLALGAATATERSKLATWIDDFTPKFTQAASNILTPPFSANELKTFADVVVVGVQNLKGIFAGLDRAQIAQVVFVEGARAVLPDGVIEEVAVNLLNSDSVKALIEEAYQRLFGENADPDAKATAEAKLNGTPVANTTDDTLPGITTESEQAAGADSTPAPSTPATEGQS